MTVRPTLGSPRGTGAKTKIKTSLKYSRAKRQRDPEVIFGQMLFWRPAVPRPLNHTCSRKEWCFGPAAEGGKAKKQLISEKCVVFWPWYPRPPKNHLAKKPLRDASEKRGQRT